MVSVVGSLVFAFRSAARSRAALHLEILALRHQLAVLNGARPRRVRLTAADRVLWAWLSQARSGWRPALVLVKPDTVLACRKLPIDAHAAQAAIAEHPDSSAGHFPGEA